MKEGETKSVCRRQWEDSGGDPESSLNEDAADGWEAQIESKWEPSETGRAIATAP